MKEGRVGGVQPIQPMAAVSSAAITLASWGGGKVGPYTLRRVKTNGLELRRPPGTSSEPF